MSLVFLHRTGSTACGQPAFRLKRLPAFGDAVFSQNATHLDGSAIEPNPLVMCDSCGRPISSHMPRDDIVVAEALSGGDAMIEVQYSHCVRSKIEDEEMPAEIRALLDRMAEKTAAQLALPISRREYLWISAGQRDKSDPMGQWGMGCIKFWVETPKHVHDIQRDGHIAREGWIRLDQFERLPEGNHQHFEIADFWFDGKPVRYGRVAYVR